MASATSSGIQVPHGNNARITAAGATSSGGSVTPSGTVFFAGAGAPFTISATTSDSNQAILTPTALGGSSVTINVGGSDINPSTSLEIPVDIKAKADMLIVTYEAVSGGKRFTIPNSTSTSSSPSINVFLNIETLISVTGTAVVSGSTVAAEITDVSITTTGTVFSLAATSSGSHSFILTSLSTSTGMFYVTARPLYTATTSGTLLFPTASPNYTFASVQAAVPEVITATYTLE